MLDSVNWLIVYWKYNTINQNKIGKTFLPSSHPSLGTTNNIDIHSLVRLILLILTEQNVISLRTFPQTSQTKAIHTQIVIEDFCARIYITTYIRTERSTLHKGKVLYCTYIYAWKKLRNKHKREKSIWLGTVFVELCIYITYICMYCGA